MRRRRRGRGWKVDMSRGRMVERVKVEREVERRIG